MSSIIKNNINKIKNCDISAPQQYLNPKRNICHVCTKSTSKYKCPRCNVPYCSLKCYKEHDVDCTEEFYKEWVEEEMKNNVEFTYTEFEELREIGKIDDVSNTEKINIINSMIKKRREEEKRIAEARRQKAIKKAIEAEKKRIREEQKAKDDAERRKMEAERRRIERERRRKEKIAEEKERQRRMKEAKARAKAAKRERQRRQHQFFDFEEDMADAFFEEMFRRRFAGSFFFGNRGFGGGHYYDPGEENREKLKKKKLAAYELFELPDEASEADVNRAYKKKALLTICKSKGTLFTMVM